MTSSFYTYILDHYLATGHEKNGLEQVGIEILSGDTPGKIVWGGSLGLAEAYMAGSWKSENLEQTLCNVLKVYFHRVDNVWPYSFFYNRERRLRPGNDWQKRPDHEDSANHYNEDIAIYNRMLDTKSLVYTFTYQNTGDLSEDQLAKFDTIYVRSNLQPGQKMLNIGTGFGGWERYCLERGIHVLTVTNSRQHSDYVTQNILPKHDDMLHVFCVDYDDPSLEFLYNACDVVTSIEMIEALHPFELSNYFATCKKFLKPDGLIYVQTITTKDTRVGKDDFLDKYIFPGGWLTKIDDLNEYAKQVGLKTVEVVDRDISNYTYTLRTWKENLLKNQPKSLSEDPYALRKWEYYLSFCIAITQLGEMGLYTLVLKNEI